MNQVFAGTAGLILALLLWGLGKKPRSDLSRKVHKKLLNDQTLVLVERGIDPKKEQPRIASKLEINWQPPKTIQENIFLRKKLYQLMSGSPEERYQAMILSNLWGHSTVLPILRRGIKDSDSYVVIAAAKALEKYKGGATLKNQESDMRRPPRNVALMR